MGANYVKEIRELRRLAEDQGWKVEPTESGHLCWTPPVGRCTNTSSTPSGGRAMMNIKGDLRRMGLVMSRSEWRRVQAEQKLEPLDQAPVPGWVAATAARVEAACKKSGIEFNFPEERTPFLPAALLELAAIINEKTGQLDMTCKCGRQFSHPVGFLRHRKTCEKVSVSSKEEAEVDRNMQQRPPFRERLDCPDCPEWFWVSQPDMRDKHALTQHGKRLCPNCTLWYGVGGGAWKKHVELCSSGQLESVTVSENITPILARIRPSIKRKEVAEVPEEIAQDFLSSSEREVPMSQPAAGTPASRPSSTLLAPSSTLRCCPSGRSAESKASRHTKEESECSAASAAARAKGATIVRSIRR